MSVRLPAGFEPIDEPSAAQATPASPPKTTTLPPGFEPVEDASTPSVTLPPGFEPIDDAAAASPAPAITPANTPGFGGVTVEQQKSDPFLQIGADTYRGIRQLGGLYKNFKGLGQKIAGNDEGAQKTLQEAAAYNAETEAKLPRVVKSVKDVGSLEDAARYASENVFEQLPIMAPSMLAGGIGGIVGKQVVKSAAVKAAEGLTGRAAATAAAKVLQSGMVKGAAIGAGIGAFPMNTGETVGNLNQATGDVPILNAIATGTVKSALDVVPEISVIKRWFRPGIVGSIGEEPIKQAREALLKKLAGAVFVDGMKESVTEVMQNWADRISQKIEDGQPIDMKAALDEDIDTAAGVWIATGLMGGAGEATSHVREGAARAGRLTKVQELRKKILEARGQRDEADRIDLENANDATRLQYSLAMERGLSHEQAMEVATAANPRAELTRLDRINADVAGREQESRELSFPDVTAQLRDPRFKIYTDAGYDRVEAIRMVKADQEADAKGEGSQWRTDSQGMQRATLGGQPISTPDASPVASAGTVSSPVSTGSGVESLAPDVLQAAGVHDATGDGAAVVAAQIKAHVEQGAPIDAQAIADATGQPVDVGALADAIHEAKQTISPPEPANQPLSQASPDTTALAEAEAGNTSKIGDVVTEQDGSQYEVVAIREDGSVKKRGVRTKRWTDDYGRTWHDGYTKGQDVTDEWDNSKFGFEVVAIDGNREEGKRLVVSDVMSGNGVVLQWVDAKDQSQPTRAEQLKQKIKAKKQPAVEPSLKVGDRIPWKNSPDPNEEVKEIEVVRLTPSFVTVRWVGGDKLQKIPRTAVEERIKVNKESANANEVKGATGVSLGEQPEGGAEVRGSHTEGGQVAAQGEGAQGKDQGAKPPELMTPEEWAEAHPLQAKIVRYAHPQEIVDASRKKSPRPLLASAVDQYGIKLPEGYVRQGDRYVYQPKEAATPPASTQLAAPEAESTDSKEPWQMTQAEIIAEDTYGNRTDKGNWTDARKAEALKTHQQEVQIAIREGKPVPAEVLADYPDLSAPTKAAALKAKVNGKAKKNPLSNPPPGGFTDADKVRTVVGVNQYGVNIEKDHLGARSILDNGFRKTQPVQIVPGMGTGAGILTPEELFKTGRTEFLTAEELAKFKGEASKETISAPLAALRHHVTGAIERGEKEAIVEQPPAPAEPLQGKDDKPEPHFKKGQRVVIKGERHDDISGRHGVIVETHTSTITTLYGGNRPMEYSHSYSVKTDEGYTEPFARGEELEPETEKPASVVNDPVDPQGHSANPAYLLRQAQSDKQSSIRYRRQASGRRKASLRMADEKQAASYLVQHEQKIAILKDWAAKNSEAAAKVEGLAEALNGPNPAQSAPTASGPTPSPAVKTDTIGQTVKVYHTKRQRDVWVVPLNDRVSREDYVRFKNMAVKLSGDYSKKWHSSPAGFMFDKQENAEKFRAEATGSTVVEKPTTVVETPVFKPGDRVTVDEGSGTVANVVDGQVRILLDSGRYSKYISPSRVQREAASENQKQYPDLTVSGQASPVPDRPGATYVVHNRKPVSTDDRKFRVIITRQEGFLSVDGKGMTPEEAYDQAVRDYDDQMAKRTKATAAAFVAGGRGAVLPNAPKPKATEADVAAMSDDDIDALLDEAKAEAFPTQDKSLKEPPKLTPPEPGTAKPTEAQKATLKELLAKIEDGGAIIFGVGSTDFGLPGTGWPSSVGLTVNHLGYGAFEGVKDGKKLYFDGGGMMQANDDHSLSWTLIDGPADEMGYPRQAVIDRIKELTKEPTKAEAIKARIPRPAEAAKQNLKDAKQHAGEAFDAAAQAIRDILGNGGRLGMGVPLDFDADTYAKVKPHLKTMWESSKAVGHDLKQFAINAYKALGEAAKPYLKRFMDEIRANTLDAESGQGDNINGGNEDENAVDQRQGSSENGNTPNVGGETEPAGDGDRGQLVGNQPEAGQGVGGKRGTPGKGSTSAGTGIGKPISGEESGNESSGGSRGVRDVRAESQAVANYSPSETDRQYIEDRGDKRRFKDAIVALKLLQVLRAENRQATPAEQAILFRYPGWGGLKGAFSDSNKAWAREYEQLRQLIDDGVITNDQYAAMRASIQDAHYTSPTVITHGLHAALERFGFSGGRMVEGGSGIGLIQLFIPDAWKNSTSYVGIERDPITSEIAKHLLPQADIHNSDFQKAVLSRGSYDASAGNPPFGSNSLYFSHNKAINKFSLHNQFIAEQIELLRPGGIGAFVVSRYFLDAKDPSARNYIAKKAAFLGAIRLPNTAFKGNAATEVTTDLVFFQRLPEGEKPGKGIFDALNGLAKSGDWLSIGEFSDAGGTVGVNQWMLDHPEMMLGTPSTQGKLQAGEVEFTLEPRPDQNLASDLDAAVSRLPENIYQQADPETVKRLSTPIDVSSELPEGVKIGTYFVGGKSGRIYRRLSDVDMKPRAEIVDFRNATAEERATGIIKIRDILNRLVAAEMDDSYTERGLNLLRHNLNNAYDAFVKKHGLLNNSANKQAYRDSDDIWRVFALERDYDAGMGANTKAVKEGREIAREPSATKAAIFTRRVNAPYREITSVNTSKEALSVSLNQRGEVDLKYMAKLSGKSQDQIISDLRGEIYLTPEGWQQKARAGSGDVRRKHNDAEAAAKGDPGNIHKREYADFVKAQIPKDISYADIAAPIGAPWIDPRDYSAFAVELTEEAPTTVQLNRANGGWYFKHRDSGPRSTQQWGTQRAPFGDLMYLMMNRKPVVIYDTWKDANGTERKEVNQGETELANAKATEIRLKFDEWLWRDVERRARLHRVYNDTYNNYVEPKYDGAHLELPGVSQDISLRTHQKNVIWRTITDLRVLYDHVVGAGKTFAGIASFMEMKRIGRVRKPLFVVPNHLVRQWRDEFVKLYPNANILATEPSDFKKENRQKLFGKILTGEFDAVIVGHSSFKKIGMSAESEAEFLNEQLAIIEEAIRQAEAVAKSEGKKKRSRTQAQYEKMRDSIKAKLQALADRTGDKDAVASFEELGIDGMFVDEYHELGKNLFYTTQMQNVAGLGSPRGSGKAFDLYMKTRYLGKRYNGKAPIVFATGTPISNSMVEMFTLQRYLQGEQLERMGLRTLDAWAAVFGRIEPVYEVDPSGTRYRLSTRFREFGNVGDLAMLYRTVADVVTNEDLQAQAATRGERFPIPKVKGGKPQTFAVQRSDRQADYFEAAELDENGNEKRDGAGNIKYKPWTILGRINNLRNVDPTVDNMLKITNDARKSGLDHRLIDPGAPDNPDSKVNKAVDNILRIHKQWNKDKGTQLVFCDLSVPSNARDKIAQTVYYRDDNGNIEQGSGRGVKMENAPEWAEVYAIERKGKSAEDSGWIVVERNTGHIFSADHKRSAAVKQAQQQDSAEAWERIGWKFERMGELTQDEIEAWEEQNEDKVKDDDAVSLDEILAAESEFSVYDDVKAKLVKAGIPANQVAFIHDFDTPAKKQKLFDAVNRGDVRILMGSTPKMGAGMNVQKRLVALHHLDAPWRPSDLEQREGRIIRQGNMFYEDAMKQYASPSEYDNDPNAFAVEVLRYGTELTYDTRMWQIIEHKAIGIIGFRKADRTTRTLEDIGGEAANAADMKAAISGDPRIQREIELRNERSKLEALRRAWLRNQGEIEDRLRWLDGSEGRFADMEKIYLQRIELRNSNTETDDKGKQVFRFELAAGKTLEEKKGIAKIVGEVISESKTKNDVISIGRYRGFNIRVIPTLTNSSVSIAIDDIAAGRKPTYSEPQAMWFYDRGDKVDDSGFIQRIDNYLNGFEAQIEKAKRQTDSDREEAQQLRSQVGQTFKKQEDLERVQREHEAVKRDLMNNRGARNQSHAMTPELDTEGGKDYEATHEQGSGSTGTGRGAASSPLSRPQDRGRNLSRDGERWERELGSLKSRVDSRHGSRLIDRVGAEHLEVDHDLGATPEYQQAALLAKSVGLSVIPTKGTHRLNAFSGMIHAATILVNSARLKGITVMQVVRHEIAHAMWGNKDGLLKRIAGLIDTNSEAYKTYYAGQRDKYETAYVEAARARGEIRGASDELKTRLDARKRVDEIVKQELVADFSAVGLDGERLGIRMGDAFGKNAEQAQSVLDQYNRGLVDLVVSGRHRTAGMTPERSSLVTPAQDAEYLAAVEKGDMETAQRMVDEAAKKAGYTIRAHHGTVEQFNTFNKNAPSRYWQGEPGFFFTDERDAAQTYAETASELDYQNSYDSETKRRTRRPPRVVEAFLRMNNPAVEEVDGDPDAWLDSNNTDGDTIVRGSLGTTYVVHSASQIKSADAITRDDQGRVIPLSERFNEQSPDIRFMSPEKGERENERIRLDSETNTETSGSASRNEVQEGSIPARRNREEWDALRRDLRQGWRGKVDAQRENAKRNDPSKFEGFWKDVDADDVCGETEGFKNAFEHFEQYGYDVVPVKTGQDMGACVNHETKTVFIEIQPFNEAFDYYILHETGHILNQNKDREFLNLSGMVKRDAPGFSEWSKKLGRGDDYAAGEIACAYLGGMKSVARYFPGDAQALRDSLAERVARTGGAVTGRGMDYSQIKPEDRKTDAERQLLEILGIHEHGYEQGSEQAKADAMTKLADLKAKIKTRQEAAKTKQAEKINEVREKAGLKPLERPTIKSAVEAGKAIEQEKGRMMSIEYSVDKALREQAKEHGAGAMEWLERAAERLALLDRQLKGAKDGDDSRGIIEDALKTVLGDDGARLAVRAAKHNVHDVLRYVREVMDKKLAGAYRKALAKVFDRYFAQNEVIPNPRMDKLTDEAKAKATALLDQMPRAGKVGVVVADLQGIQPDTLKRWFNEWREIMALNQLDREVRIGQERHLAAKASEMLIEELSESHEPMVESGVRPKNRGTIRDIMVDFYANQSLLAQRAFGGLKSLGHQLFYKSLESGENEYKAQKHRAQSELGKELDRLGVSFLQKAAMMTELKPVKADDQTILMTDAERMHLAAFIGVENEGKITGGRLIAKYHILRDGFIRESLAGTTAKVASENMPALVADIIKTLTPTEKAIVKKIIEIQTGMGEAGNRVSRQLLGRSLFTEDWYMGMKPERVQEINADELGTNQAAQKFLENSGFTKTVVEHTHPIKIGNIFAAFDEHVDGMSRYIGLTIPLRNIRTAMKANDSALTREINSRIGTDWTRRVTQTMMKLAGAKNQDQHGPAKMLATLSGNVMRSLLAWNPSSYFNNRVPGAIMLAAAIAEKHPKAAAKIISGLAVPTQIKTRLNPLPLTRFGEENERIRAYLMEHGYLGDRWDDDYSSIASPVNRDVASQLKGKAQMIIRHISNVALNPMMHAEIRNGIDAFKALRAEGLSEERARELVAEATRATQNSSSALDDSAFIQGVRDFGLGGLFPFLSQNVVTRNFLASNIADKDRAGTALAVAGITASIAGTVLFRSLIRSLRNGPDDDKDKAEEERVINSINQTADTILPGIGMVVEPMLNAAFGQYRGGGSLIFERQLGEVSKLAGKIASGKPVDADAATKFIKALTQLLGLPTGGVYSVGTIAHGMATGYEPGNARERQDRTHALIVNSAKRLPDSAGEGRIRLESLRVYNQAKRDGLLKSGTTEAEFRARYRSAFKRLNP